MDNAFKELLRLAAIFTVVYGVVWGGQLYIHEDTHRQIYEEHGCDAETTYGYTQLGDHHFIGGKTHGCEDVAQKQQQITHIIQSMLRIPILLLCFIIAVMLNE